MFTQTEGFVILGINVVSPLLWVCPLRILTYGVLSLKSTPKRIRVYGTTQER